MSTVAGTKPLADLRVMELGQIYNGPYCGLLFAHLGADVVKIESPRGELLRFREDPNVESREFLMLNSSKRSLPIDLKTDEGKAVFFDLVDQCDVLIENFSVGVMDRLGLGYEAVHARNSRIVYARGTGYGTSGPLSGVQAMDITIQAFSGVLATTGFPDGPPVKSGPAFADFIGGAHLFAGAMAAIHKRDVTGAGSLVEVAMYDSVVPTLASPLAAAENKKPVPERTGNRHSGLAVAPYNVYEAADGHVAIFCVSNRHWRRLVDVMGQPELLEDERFGTPHSRARHMDAVDNIVGAWALARSRAEIFEQLNEQGVPAAPVQSVEEVAHDPHLRDNGMVQTVMHPVLGESTVPGSAIRIDGQQAVCRIAPTLGADTDDVLRDVLHYSPEKIDSLRDLGVVGAESRASA